MLGRYMHAFSKGPAHYLFPTCLPEGRFRTVGLGRRVRNDPATAGSGGGWAARPSSTTGAGGMRASAARRQAGQAREGRWWWWWRGSRHRRHGAAAAATGTAEGIAADRGGGGGHRSACVCGRRLHALTGAPPRRTVRFFYVCVGPRRQAQESFLSSGDFFQI